DVQTKELLYLVTLAPPRAGRGRSVSVNFKFFYPKTGGSVRGRPKYGARKQQYRLRVLNWFRKFDWQRGQILLLAGHTTGELKLIRKFGFNVNRLLIVDKVEQNIKQ